VFVKIPITNTAGDPSAPLVRRLAKAGVQQNVTAIFTLPQVVDTVAALAGGPQAYVSVFAGRIADAGIDPIPVMRVALDVLRDHPQLELIWASPREVLNIVQASDIGCHVITVTHDLLAKLPGIGKDLGVFSLETVQMFRRDAVAAGFSL
jgi:transaldolase